MKSLILVMTAAGAWLGVDGGLGQDQGEGGEAGHHPSQHHPRHPRHHYRAITITIAITIAAAAHITETGSRLSRELQHPPTSLCVQQQHLQPPAPPRSDGPRTQD